MEVLPKLYEKLTKAEARKLNKILRLKHGNIVACSEKTGLNANTLKRAKDGLDILVENAKIIREVLLKSENVAA